MSRRTPRRPQPPLNALEIVCVVLVLAAVVALFVWIGVNAGGGHFLT